MIYKLKLIVNNYCNSITSKYFILLNYKFILFKTKPENHYLLIYVLFLILARFHSLIFIINIKTSFLKIFPVHFMNIHSCKIYFTRQSYTQ